MYRDDEHNKLEERIVWGEGNTCDRMDRLIAKSTRRLLLLIGLLGVSMVFISVAGLRMLSSRQASREPAPASERDQLEQEAARYIDRLYPDAGYRVTCRVGTLLEDASCIVRGPAGQQDTIHCGVGEGCR